MNRMIRTRLCLLVKFIWLKNGHKMPYDYQVDDHNHWRGGESWIEYSMVLQTKHSSSSSNRRIWQMYWWENFTSFRDKARWWGPFETILFMRVALDDDGDYNDKEKNGGPFWSKTSWIGNDDWDERSKTHPYDVSFLLSMEKEKERERSQEEDEEKTSKIFLALNSKRSLPLGNQHLRRTKEQNTSI